MYSNKHISLQELDLLTQFYIHSSIEPSTRLLHNAAWSLWEQFSTSYDGPTSPSTPQWIIRYVTWLAYRHYVPGTIYSYLGSIGAVYTSSGCNDWPALRATPSLKRVLHGIKKDYMRHRHQRKKHHQFFGINDLKNTLRPNSNYNNILFNAMLLTGFYGCHRLAELTTSSTSKHHHKSIKFDNLFPHYDNNNIALIKYSYHCRYPY